jgi:hypothetical protein
VSSTSLEVSTTLSLILREFARTSVVLEESYPGFISKESTRFLTNKSTLLNTYTKTTEKTKIILSEPILLKFSNNDRTIAESK